MTTAPGVAATDARGGPPARRPTDGRRRVFWALLLPSVAVLVAFLVVPLVMIAALSLRPDLRGPLLAPFAPTLDHYVELAATPVYLRLLAISAGIAAIVAALATLLAFPLAYYLALRAGRRAPMLIILLLVPFWTSYLLRVMAWKLMLGEQGAINSLLLSSGVIDAPLSALLYNRLAVTITLAYVWIPFAALPMLAALQRLDPLLLDAAADLYATPARRFWRITLPIAMPGVVGAFFLVFIPTVGEYVTPLMVGGTGGTMYGNIVQDFFTKAANWPFGSMLSVVMLVATIAVALLAVRAADVRRFVDP
ncbi:MAG TPA: ABC transporter permease [Candidatus Limnocylindrales bacterium]